MSKALLEDLGRWTWKRIGHGKRLGVRQGETTVTDTLLLDIEIHGSTTRVFKVPHTWERITGTDYDLFLRRPDGRWARLLVQSKMLNASGTRYDSLGHRVNGKRQIDLLLRMASLSGGFPLYAFYNEALLARPSLYWHCPNPLDVELLGWTVTPAWVVDEALHLRGKRTFDFIHGKKATVPARCLLECMDCYLGPLGGPHKNIKIGTQALNGPQGGRVVAPQRTPFLGGPAPRNGEHG